MADWELDLLLGVAGPPPSGVVEQRVRKRAIEVLQILCEVGRRNEVELAQLANLTRGRLDTALRRLQAANLVEKEDGMWAVTSRKMEEEET